MARRFIHHRVTAVRHGSGNAGGKEGLAQACIAGEQQIGAFLREAVGIPAAGLEGALHNAADVVFFGVVIQAELLKGFLAHIQEGQFLFLLLAAQLRQTFAHGAAHIAQTAAAVADGAVVQIAFFKIQRSQFRTLLLQQQIFPAGLLHHFLHIAALDKGGLGSLGHGQPQLAVDLLQAGHFTVGLLQMFPVFRFPVRPGFGQTGAGAIHYFLAVGHAYPSCSSRAMAACSSLSKLRVAVLPPLRSPLRTSAAVRRPISFHRARILCI